MSEVVYAKADCVVVWSGGQSPLSRGDVWDARAPLVLERPDLFSTEPTRVRGRRQVEAADVGEAAPVENASARPGVRRGGRRKPTTE